MKSSEKSIGEPKEKGTKGFKKNGKNFTLTGGGKHPQKKRMREANKNRQHDRKNARGGRVVYGEQCGGMCSSKGRRDAGGKAG